MQIRIETKRRVFWTPPDYPGAELELAFEPRGGEPLWDVETGVVAYVTFERGRGWAYVIEHSRDDEELVERVFQPGGAFHAVAHMRRVFRETVAKRRNEI